MLEGASCYEFQGIVFVSDQIKSRPATFLLSIYVAVFPQVVDCFET